MAKMINDSQSTISQLENGVIEMSLVTLYSLIDHMGGELQINAVFDGKKLPLTSRAVSVITLGEVIARREPDRG